MPPRPRKTTITCWVTADIPTFKFSDVNEYSLVTTEIMKRKGDHLGGGEWGKQKNRECQVQII